MFPLESTTIFGASSPVENEILEQLITCSTVYLTN